MKKLLVITLFFFNSTYIKAEEAVRIGFVTTLSTSAAVIGRDMQDAANLAGDHLGWQVAGKPLEIIFEDDGFRPEIGKQKTDKLIKKNKVDFMTGYIWTHVLLASQKAVLDAGKFLVSANAGPPELAGKMCHNNFFSTATQSDQTPMALGEELNRKGVKTLYVIAPNYAAGKNMVAGIERTFKGKVIGKDFTRWGRNAQIDFSAELSKAKSSGAEGLFAFFPGSAGFSFLQQYHQMNLADSVNLYTVFTVDSIVLPKFQDARISGILGTQDTSFWSPDLQVVENQQFVDDFENKYNRTPSFYAAQSYDAIKLIHSAVASVEGDLTNMDGMREAMEKADFGSVRGAFSYGNNHFPIQNFYIREVVVDNQGDWATKVISPVLEKHQDPYAAECRL